MITMIIRYIFQYVKEGISLVSYNWYYNNYMHARYNMEWILRICNEQAGSCDIRIEKILLPDLI